LEIDINGAIIYLKLSLEANFDGSSVQIPSKKKLETLFKNFIVKLIKKN
jgi:hypothetical protein